MDRKPERQRPTDRQIFSQADRHTAKERETDRQTVKKKTDRKLEDRRTKSQTIIQTRRKNDRQKKTDRLRNGRMQ